jgi:hypothetical protein
MQFNGYCRLYLRLRAALLYVGFHYHSVQVSTYMAIFKCVGFFIYLRVPFRCLLLRCHILHVLHLWGAECDNDRFDNRLLSLCGCCYGQCFYFSVCLSCAVSFEVRLSVQFVGCDRALAFILLCVGLMAIFCGVTFFSAFLSIGVYFVVSRSWCGVSRLSLSLWHSCQLSNPS